MEYITIMESKEFWKIIANLFPNEDLSKVVDIKEWQTTEAKIKMKSVL